MGNRDNIRTIYLEVTAETIAGEVCEENEKRKRSEIKALSRPEKEEPEQEIGKE